MVGSAVSWMYESKSCVGLLVWGKDGGVWGVRLYRVEWYWQNSSAIATLISILPFCRGIDKGNMFPCLPVLECVCKVSAALIGLRIVGKLPSISRHHRAFCEDLQEVSPGVGQFQLYSGIRGSFMRLF